MISTKERATLRSFANNLPDLVFVGKDGVTDNVIKQVVDNLTAHELIKIKVQKSVNDDIKAFANEIEERCKGEVVAIMGNKIIVYKVTEKPKFEHLL